jgi:hypothetical protein
MAWIPRPRTVRKGHTTYITEIAPTDDGYDFTGLTQMIGWRDGLQHAPRLAAAAF